MKKQQGGNDAKFFATNRKGENHELREELRSQVRDKKRDAVKKVSRPAEPLPSHPLTHTDPPRALSACTAGHRQHDGRKGRVHALHGCRELHPDRYAGPPAPS